MDQCGVRYTSADTVGIVTHGNFNAGSGSHASRWRPRLLAKFPHMPGSRVCETLFSHFLAADGT